MVLFALRRVGRGILVVLLVSFLVVALLSLAPGSLAAVLLGEGATPQAIAELESELGLDQSMFQQWITWVWNALHGDLGTSVLTGQSVAAAIWAGLPVTLEIAILALAMSLVISIPLAVWAARHPGGSIDRGIGALTSALLSIPAFVAAPFLIYIFAVQLGWFPVSGWTPLSESITGNLLCVFLPALSISLVEVAAFQRILRTDLGTTMREDYIAAARAKGLPSGYVMRRHVFRPSSFSLLTLAGIGLGRLLGGTIIVESLFGLPGIGQLVAGAVTSRDVIVVQGVVAFIAIVYVFLNTFVDVGYGYLDPRVRLGAAR